MKRFHSTRFAISGDGSGGESKGLVVVSGKTLEFGFS
jgi:hypothetical protein